MTKYFEGQKTDMVELIPKISDTMDCVLSSDEKLQFDT